jgi:DNA-binding PadR family transcriptional regulator
VLKLGESERSKSMGLELSIKGIKGIFRDIALYALYRLEEAHGYAIRSFISELLGVYTPSSGILYPTLRELEREGLITSKSGNRRKIYALTPKGREYIESRIEYIEKLLGKVEKAVKILLDIGLLNLLNTIRDLWESDVDIPPGIIVEIKQRVEDIRDILLTLKKK